MGGYLRTTLQSGPLLVNKKVISLRRLPLGALPINKMLGVEYSQNSSG